MTCDERARVRADGPVRRRRCGGEAPRQSNRQSPMADARTTRRTRMFKQFCLTFSCAHTFSRSRSRKTVERFRLLLFAVLVARAHADGLVQAWVEQNITFLWYDSG